MGAPKGIRGTKADIRPGQMFGSWKMLEPGGYEPGKDARWRARCKCGTIRNVIVRHVVNGRSTNCGCSKNSITNSRTRSDKIIAIRKQIGKQCSICLQYKPLGDFGKDKKNRDGHKLACSPCDAAYQRDYRAAQPKKPSKPGRRLPIAVGTQYNDLTIVREDGHIGQKRAFIATCVCGTEVRATLRSMMKGEKRSCGCQLDEKFQKIQASLALRSELKVCGTCQEEKPLTQFQGKRSRVGGVLHRIYPDDCKSCQAKAVVPWAGQK